MELTLRERGGPIAVAPSDWKSLRLEDTVGALGRNGILRVERTSAAILLFPSHYVGEMRAPNVKLTIRPKDEALHQAMLSLALRFDGREARHYDATVFGEDGDDLVLPFVRALADCVGEGLPWRYEREIEATSRPRGKPHFAKTIADFVSRGIMHKVVAGRQERHQAEAFVSVAWTAYQCLPSAPGAVPELIRRAAMLIEALQSTIELSGPDAIEAAETLLAESDALSKSARDLMAASLALLDREQRTGKAAVPLPAGAARFMDLERVWERAVASLVAEIETSADSVVAIHGLSGERLRLFGHAGPAINPDVVVSNKLGDTELIADAKYKVMGEKERDGIASDVYQLTCYVERAEASVGMLVYVGTTDSVSELGHTQTGNRILSIRISAELLISDGHQALARILVAEKPLVESV